MDYQSALLWIFVPALLLLSLAAIGDAWVSERNRVSRERQWEQDRRMKRDQRPDTVSVDQPEEPA